ncbi:ethanolamine transporter [Kineosphaera limosa]|uniref:Ethanolamine utilization protein EutH n=1 Tax=Kineosphaera limosa NBRC 100340 TaxID=1184609 RepID=K6X0K4_9MICO|nr:ethanolamine utilization protein EutH [Kineosphaera limosa]NYD99809.1 ethanolamine transporter [Kineosphaera limosa]GAB97877.1 ethanolamine utilization protein EutH [Kineosphaera limosa NBRC 100340]
MSINEIIVWILMISMLAGAVDRILGNRIGLGEQFEEGLNALGPLALAMVGVVSLAPVLKKVLEPVIAPTYEFLGADPSMFATTLLANDMGGAPLAMSLARDPEAGLLAALILGAMMGPTIVFTIPVALGIIEKGDRQYLAKGVLAGITTIPIGVLVGGLVAGFDPGMVLRNLIPITIAAALIVLGLVFAPERMTRGFELFGKGLVILITIGLAWGVFQQLTGVRLIAMPAGAEGDPERAALEAANAWFLDPPTEGLAIVGSIAMVLMGAFPLVYLIVKYLSKPLSKAGRMLGINDSSAGGMIATLANNIPMFQIYKNMDNRGKTLNAAFAVSAAFTFGDHLGFTAGFMYGGVNVGRDMIFPMIAGKLIAGITAVAVAYLLFRRSFPPADAEGKVAATEEGSAA